MNPENIMLSEISQLQKRKYYIIHLYDVSKVIKILEVESRMVVVKG